MVQEQLIRDRHLPQNLVNTLHHQNWLYADDLGQAVFVERTLNGEPTGAFVLDSQATFSCTRLDSDTNLSGCFWVATQIPIQRAVLASDPMEVLSVASLDPDFNQTPTLYLATARASSIPQEFLEALPTVVVGLKGDEKGNAVSEEILKLLPQAKRINPGIAGWNEMLTDKKELIESDLPKLHKKQTGDQGLDID